MGIIEEPDGVDFIISGGHWSEAETAEVAEFIRNHKREQKAQEAAAVGDKVTDLPATESLEEHQQSLTVLSH